MPDVDPSSSFEDAPLELAGEVVVVDEPLSPDRAAAMPTIAVKNEATAATATTFLVRSVDVLAATVRAIGCSPTGRAIGSSSIGS
jgi:hypothetical protein